MKICCICLFLFALVSGCAWADGPKEGAPAPRVITRTLDGASIDTAALRGNVMIVTFWATWCPPCREEMPALEKFYDEHHGEGLEILAISIDDAGDEAKVRQLASAYRYPIALMADSKVDGFGRIWVLPLTFVIDRKGILRKADWTGPEKVDAASLDKIVLPLLSDK